jgi:hypothetical protein
MPTDRLDNIARTLTIMALWSATISQWWLVAALLATASACVGYVRWRGQ